ncbi:aspartyl-phosphate phosphatase Spo0E family protein [Bacillus sp. 31A1R]|uniref:Aspartyl-phosphate phosphatase Spo0E family protein n=1 Tax=Robertmurraya mangrovi TaxID=3098077 RepID=A0ABU5IYJ8_9BACI|nr:aspartyl-phosphate phosphatase Spo0E family protein [Bacillus sp. 31A1R]MDZ5472186.1 aspartyl-phosphate phosphatase Spo0E family protein [Bacillus sp. 31A1R]
MDDRLLTQIERKRMELITAGLSKGFTDALTVKLSTELDHLLNQLTKNSELASYQH